VAVAQRTVKKAWPDQVVERKILRLPDPITFVVHPDFLNRGNIYPRQATLLKIIFLRDDLFTPYDLEVIEEWEESYRNTGYNGICPNVLFRIKWLKAQGYKWFREVLLVLGRRAGKGYVAALAMSYILWNYMCAYDPQYKYGIDRDKKLALMVFAGKREQAKAQVWRDVVNVITGSTCFAPFVNKVLAESLTVYAPNDFARMDAMRNRGVFNEGLDMATFEIVPKESTLMAGRGPASFAMAFDEMAHVVNSGSNRSAEDLYTAATPSLDQFGKDGFIIEPSSPWQMMGQFYENYLHAVEVDEETGEPVYNSMLMLQLTSWDIYVDWEDAHDIPLFPVNFKEMEEDPVTRFPMPGDFWPMQEGDDVPRFQRMRGAIQTYDDQMKLLKRANPETFAVERESHFAAAIDAYLNSNKVLEIFQPWKDRPAHYGPPTLQPDPGGILAISYKGHGDPSKVNDKFGIAVAHAEYDAEGKAHCVFDLLHHFNPADFDGGIIDYDEVNEWIWENVIKRYHPEEFTFDQYNSASSIQFLQKKIRAQHMPKRIQVFEVTTTRPKDWIEKENSKAAINMGLVHAPSTHEGDSYERAELELRFLQQVNGRVDHPSSGPVQSKDIADAMMNCINVLIGEQVNNFVHGDLAGRVPAGMMQGGQDPFTAVRRAEEQALEGMSNFGRGRRVNQYGTIERGPRRRR
jgi:hypothetical protein